MLPRGRGRRTPTRQTTTRRRDTRDRGRPRTPTTIKPKVPTPSIMGGMPPRPSPAAILPPGPTAMDQPTAAQLAGMQDPYATPWWGPGPTQQAIMEPISALLGRGPYSAGLASLGYGAGSMLSGMTSVAGAVGGAAAGMPGFDVDYASSRREMAFRHLAKQALYKQEQMYQPPDFVPPPPSDGGGYYRPTRGRSYGTRAARVSQTRRTSLGLVNWRIGL